MNTSTNIANSIGISANKVGAETSLNAGDIVIVSCFNDYRIGMVHADSAEGSEMCRITFDGKFGYEVNPIFVVGKIDDDNFPDDDKALAKLERVFREGLIGPCNSPEEYENSLLALARNETPVSVGDFIVFVAEPLAEGTRLELGNVISVEPCDGGDKVEFRGRFRKIEGPFPNEWDYKRFASRVIPIKLPPKLTDNWYIER